MVPDGDLILDPVSQKTIINATDRLYFDGGTDTYIAESGADVLDFYVGAVNLLKLTEAGGGALDKVSIEAQAGFYLDGGNDTYIYEASADYVRFMVGDDLLMSFDENGADGNQVLFSDASAGFTQIASTSIASTPVDFRHSNKLFVTFDDFNITHLVIYFPSMSGNFQLLLKQDGTGSRTITGSYKVYAFDENVADGSNVVKFAGGSNPTLTTDANHVDIISFYWDNDNEIAYGVATLDFQF